MGNTLSKMENMTQIEEELQESYDLLNDLQKQLGNYTSEAGQWKSVAEAFIILVTVLLTLFFLVLAWGRKIYAFCTDPPDQGLTLPRRI